MILIPFQKNILIPLKARRQDFTDRDVLLHLFSLILHLNDPLLLFLQPRLHFVEDFLQLLLLDGQTGSHLLSLGTELRLSLKLLLKSQFLCIQLPEENKG